MHDLRTPAPRLALVDATAPALTRPADFIDNPSGVTRNRGHVSRAFATAGRHTAGGFKTAARAMRSVF